MNDRLTWAAALLMLPFFLQLLGFGQTFLGGGLCGSLIAGRDLTLDQQPPGFWYALLFMLLLAGQLAYGGVLLLSRLLEPTPTSQRALARVGVFVALPLPAAFLLTRLTGLPTPGPLGWQWGERAGLDVLSLLMVGATLAAAGLMARASRAPSPQSP
ncbi:hypothetical protein Mterra_02485 [Calidithermus terrae]|uniref:Uncharacterized protein n=1 Tax=Calidithermus terrae TaxID=1408545 RepID=A0A399EGL4_9DEIN|nr:hypothetical protein [Calidithermus terrae]RIH82876.1 hypothetical protein Mterra_02485 [Calidithermus terrae]